MNTPVGGTVAIAGTDIIFTPTPDYNGPASFNYVVEDDGTTSGAPAPLTDTGAVSFTITSVNDLPSAGADAITRRPGLPTKVAVTALLSNDSDPEGGTLTLTLPSATSVNGATITREGGWVIYSAPVNDNADSFTYTVTDPDGGTAVGTVNVTVELDTTASVNVLAIETDGLDKVIRFVGIPGVVYTVQFTLDLNSGSWTTLGSVPAGPNGRFQYRDVNPPPPQRFYRTTYP